MKFRSLAAIPFVALALLWIALYAVGETHRATVFRVDIELAKVAALVGCAAAGLRFARGDYLRTAWLLQAQCYLFILITDACFRAGVGVWSHRSWAPLAGGIVIGIANLGQLVGTWMLARVWRVAGFELAGSRGVRVAVQLTAIGFAIAAGGPLMLTGAHDLQAGQMTALIDLFSTASDIVSFALIAPFLLTAIALRGGSLAWTWGLFTASLLSWLLFDASFSYGTAIWTTPAGLKVASESFRLLACTFGFAAGMAQRFAVGQSLRS